MSYASNNSLTLFSTAACHLCEQALGLLQPCLGQGDGWILQEVDISECDDLFQRYGLIIPVLRHAASGAELHWPFDAATLTRFLAACARGGETP